jgi:hypothetical protein
MTRAAWLLVVLCAAAAQAERARIAVHPLLADTVDDANIKQSIEDDIRNVVVSTRKLSPVGTDEVATALRAAKRCPAQREERLRCLESLAFTTGATYAVAIELKQLGSSFELSGLLAAADRTVLTAPAVVRAKAAEELPSALRTLLLSHLKLDQVSASPAELARLLLPPPVDFESA